jgi:FkbM family methyltransferase
MDNFCFKPTSMLGRIFKAYLKSPEHYAKVPVNNLIGSKFFNKGIEVKAKDGTKFVLEANDWMTRIILEKGCYEIESLSLAQSILNNGGVFFDIGANFGLFSCIMSKNKKVKTYAFEPNYDTVGTLIKNVQLNKISENIKIINAGLSDNNRLVFFSVPNEYNKGTARYEHLSSSSGFMVGTFSLENVINNFKVQTIKLIKIDIEGNEMDVFRDFDFKKNEVENIIMEYNDLSNISFSEIKSFFEMRDYEVRNIRGALLNSIDGIIESNLWLKKIG